MNWCSRTNGYCVCTSNGDAVTCPFALHGSPMPTPAAFASQGWECPRCRAINAPTTPRCDCKPGDLNKVT